MSEATFIEIELCLAWLLAIAGVVLGLHWMRRALVGFVRGRATLGRSIGSLVFPMLLIATVVAAIATGRFPSSPRDAVMTGSLPGSGRQQMPREEVAPQTPSVSAKEEDKSQTALLVTASVAFGLVAFAIAMTQRRNK
jgi:hypothetical protein